MLNSTLSLTPHQHQVIGDLGLDAWYLKPLSRAELDRDYQTSQEEIAHIIEELVPPSENPDDISTPMSQPIDSSNTPPISQSNQSPIGQAPIGQQQTAPQPIKDTLSLSQQVRTVMQSSEPIKITADMDLTPPKDTLIEFPDSGVSVPDDMSAIHTAIADLSNNAIGVESPKTLSGTGSEQPKWLIIIPPPTAKHLQAETLFDDSEQQLFNEMLAAIGKTWKDIYVTPLLKQSVYKQKDPDASLLAKHLPILQAEISALNPKRIIIMGREPSHALLSTKAPLSQLMHEDYQLRVGGKQYPLTVLPSVHYFLAIPAEKRLLWQRLKVFYNA